MYYTAKYIMTNCSNRKLEARGKIVEKESIWSLLATRTTTYTIICCVLCPEMKMLKYPYQGTHCTLCYVSARTPILYTIYSWSHVNEKRNQSCHLVSNEDVSSCEYLKLFREWLIFWKLLNFQEKIVQYQQSRFASLMILFSQDTSSGSPQGDV